MPHSQEARTASWRQPTKLLQGSLGLSQEPRLYSTHLSSQMGFCPSSYPVRKGLLVMPTSVVQARSLGFIFCAPTKASCGIGGIYFWEPTYKKGETLNVIWQQGDIKDVATSKRGRSSHLGGLVDEEEAGKSEGSGLLVTTKDASHLSDHPSALVVSLHLDSNCTQSSCHLSVFRLANLHLGLVSRTCGWGSVT